MADVFTTRERSAVMRAVQGKNTAPEMIVRRLAHALGYRYTLHVKSLPGQPDLVFPSRRKVIFVHGCFWHRHRCPRGDRLPQTRREYWLRKLEGNRLRDRRHRSALRKLGWRVLVIWECRTRDPKRVAMALQRFLGD